MHSAQENRAIDLVRASLATKENEICQREGALMGKESELELQVRSLEPSLRSAERERQMALTTIEDSERRLTRLLDKENRILEAERGLRSREQTSEEALAQALDMKASLTQTILQSRREKEKVDGLKNSLNAER